MKIFILEKKEEIYKELKTLLESHNLETEVIKTFKLFKRKFLESPPDMIICNPVFEGFSPFYFIRWVRNEINSNVPIIAYHPNPTKELLLLAKRYKVNSFTIYPFNHEDLLKRIFKILGLKNNIKPSIEKKDLNLIRKNKIMENIKRKIEQLPPSPTIIKEIENLINSEKSSASDFEEVIKKDQVITAKVLKIVNSPFFSLQRKISTISESVAYMGYDTLRSVVYSAFTSRLLNISLPAYGYKKNELWKHSYITACFSKEIARYLNFLPKIQEEIFVGGLLHDIGKLVIGAIAKEEKIDLFEEHNNKTSLIEIEKKYFYLNHQETGFLIAEKWHLPDIHKSIISNHHLTIEKEINSEICVVNVADFISKKLLNLKITEHDKIILESALEKLKIDRYTYNILEKNCEQSMSKIDIGIF